MSRFEAENMKCDVDQLLTILVVGCLVLTTLPVVTANLETSGQSTVETVPALDQLPGEGTAENPYEISNASELSAIRQDLEAHYVIVEDIDASETAEFNNGKGFGTIGRAGVNVDNQGVGFGGVLNGQNHTVSHLMIGSGAQTGLFHVINKGAVVKNIRFSDITVNSQSNAGTVAAYCNGGKVQNVVASGEATASYSVGGLVSATYGDCLVSNSGASVQVSGRDAGGLVEEVADTSTIEKSFATGDVASTHGNAAPSGGLIGHVDQSSSATVINSYARGDVEGTYFTGGLIGQNLGSPSVRKVFSTGSVGSGKVVGGFIGSVSSNPQEAYWDEDTAGTPSAYGESDDVVTTRPTALTTDKMTGASARSSMSGLDFGETWVATDEYPILAWQVDEISLDAPDRMLVNETASVAVNLHLKRGETVTATTTASYDTNTSTLSVDGTTLQPSSNGTVGVTASLGPHSTTKAVEVVRPPDVSVESTSLPYEKVGSDFGARMEVTLNNDGGPTDYHDIKITANNETTTQTVAIDGYTTKTATLSWKPEPGTYDLSIGNTSVGTVEVVSEAGVSVGETSLSASEVTPGETVEVTATLEATNGAATEHKVAFTAGGETVSSETVVVPPEGTEVSFDWSSDSTGTYDLAVDGTSAGSVTVAEEQTPTETETNDGGSNGDSDNAGDNMADAETTTSSGPGFGVVVALISLLAVGLSSRKG